MRRCSRSRTRHARARDAFEALGKSDQYAVILQLLKVRTPAARAARLEKIITMLTDSTKS